MLAGEPGIGKTRLAEEASSRAAAEGFRVSWGGCTDRAPPYRPWQQVVRSLIRALGTTDAARLMGTSAGVIAAMLPFVCERLGCEPEPQAAEDPVSGRHRFFDAVAAFLTRLSDEEPLLVVLEDLHWADTQSLELLSFLSFDLSDSRIVVLATYRPMEVTLGNPFADTLGWLARMTGTLRIGLSSFGRNEILSLLRDVHDQAPSEELAESLLAKTDGNPLFVVELVRTLPRHPRLAAEDELGRELAVPESIREVIRSRLLRIGTDCRRLLEVAAVVGREVRLAVLEAVLGDAGTRGVVALVDEAVKAGFLEGPSDGAPTCRFTHALLQESIREVTPVAERARLHAETAAALESEYGDACDDHAEELAMHLSGALGAADADKVAYYHRVAGDRAFSAYAFTEAKRHYEAALAANSSSSSPMVQAELLAGLGKAMRRLGDQEGAARSLTRAFSLYRQAGATDKARDLAAYPWGAAARSRSIRAVREMYEAALCIAEEDTLNEAHILLNAVESSYRGDERTHRERLLRALAIAQRLEATELSVRIISCLTGVLERLLDEPAASRYADMAMRLANEQASPVVKCLAAQCICRRDHLLRPPVEEYRKHARDHLNAAEVLRDRMLMDDAHYECMQGAWEAADWEEMRRHVEAMGRLMANSEQNAFMRCRRASIELETGRTSQAKAELRKAVELVNGVSASRYEQAAVSAYLARYSWWLGQPLSLPEAEAYALQARRYARSEPQAAYYARQTLAMIAVIRGDREEARHWYDVFTDNLNDPCPRERCLLPGALAMTVGMMDAAVLHLEEGLRETQERGDLYNQRWLMYHLAKSLFRRNQPGDPKQALAVLEELLQIAERTGSVLVREKAALLQRTVRETPGPSRPRRHPDELTPREVEVLRLIARGYTNPEIAQALFISPATAATHAYRILHKTGMANRAEVTAWAIRNGVVEA